MNIKQRTAYLKTEFNKDDFKHFFEDQLSKFPVEQTLCVTLTFKTYCYQTGQYIDEYRAVQNMKHFMNKLNCKYYGNAFRRYNKRLNVIAALDKSLDDRLHYHTAIKIPDRDLQCQNTSGRDRRQVMMLMIGNIWRATDFGNLHVHFQDAFDVGSWIFYGAKTNRTKNEDDQRATLLKVDHENTYAA